MDKTFKEVVSNITGSREVEGLLPLIDVSRLKYSEGKEYLLIYLKIRRLVDKEMVTTLEELINKEYLAELPTRARADTVHILFNIDHFLQRFFIDLCRQRTEHQNAVYSRIPVDLFKRR